jgi:hypothetical protein
MPGVVEVETRELGNLILQAVLVGFVLVDDIMLLKYFLCSVVWFVDLCQPCWRSCLN